MGIKAICRKKKKIKKLNDNYFIDNKNKERNKLKKK